MADKKKVLITGDSGPIGGLIRKNLGDKYDFSALNRSKVEGIRCVQADIADAEGIEINHRGIEFLQSVFFRRICNFHSFRFVNIEQILLMRVSPI